MNNSKFNVFKVKSNYVNCKLVTVNFSPDIQAPGSCFAGNRNSLYNNLLHTALPSGLDTSDHIC